MKSKKNEYCLYINYDGILIEKFSEESYAEVEGVIYNYLSDELEYFYNVRKPDL